MLKLWILSCGFAVFSWVDGQDSKLVEAGDGIFCPSDFGGDKYWCLCAVLVPLFDPEEAASQLQRLLWEASCRREVPEAGRLLLI